MTRFSEIVTAKPFAVPGFPDMSLSDEGNYVIRFLSAGNKKHKSKY